MAKAGVISRPRSASGAGAETRRLLIEAAVETLKSEGYAKASARGIAKQAGCNQALVFYHFGSVVELLLAALDEVSDRRRQRYSAVLKRVTTPVDLVAAAAEVLEEDMNSGYLTVLVEMIAGASATPGLGTEVASRIAPWRELTRQAIEAGTSSSPLGSLLPLNELSYAVVALVLGLEMLTHLDGDAGQAKAVLEHVGSLASLFEMTFAPSGEEKR